jgi:hypothetical protein
MNVLGFGYSEGAEVKVRPYLKVRPSKLLWKRPAHAVSIPLSFHALTLRSLNPNP